MPPPPTQAAPCPVPCSSDAGHQAMSVNCPLGLGVVGGMGTDPGLRRPGGPGKARLGGGQRQAGRPLGAGPWLVSCLKMSDPHLVSGCWPQTIPDNCVGDSALGAEESHVNVKCEPGGSSRPRLVSVWVCWRVRTAVRAACISGWRGAMPPAHLAGFRWDYGKHVHTGILQ